MGYGDKTWEPFLDSQCRNEVQSQKCKVGKIILVKRLFVKVCMDKPEPA